MSICESEVINEEFPTVVSMVNTVLQVDNFKHCFNCKKYISGIVDMYLYMNKPFCSNECRNNVMDLDIEVEKPIKKKRVKKKMTTDNTKSRQRRKNYKPVRFVHHVTLA